MLLSHLSFTLRLDIWKNKMNKRIVFVPVGGLANRMRSVASAIALAEDTASKIADIRPSKKAQFPCAGIVSETHVPFLPL